MASKKKTRPKAKKGKKKVATRKKATARRPARKAAPRKKTAVRKKPARKAAKPKARPKSAAARKPAAAPKPSGLPAPRNEDRIGIVTHYFSHLSVAIVRLETGILREGDVLHIKGHTSDFLQPIESMEIDHAHVYEARAGQSFGLRVKEHAREHDVVYIVKR